MKREELKAIVEGITDEQLEKILNLNSADVEKMKGKLQPELEGLKRQLNEAKETVAALEAGKGDADALQAELDKYRSAEEKRAEEEKAAAEKAALTERFQAAKGDRVFSHEYIERGVMEDFAKALADAANTGKGDAELFEALTKDREGIFQSKNPPADMGGIGRVDPGQTPNSLAGALKERYEMKG